MQIHIRESDAGGGETELYGRLLDQSALAGVLTALYDLHLPIVSVKCEGSESLEPT